MIKLPVLLAPSRHSVLTGISPAKRQVESGLSPGVGCATRGRRKRACQCSRPCSKRTSLRTFPRSLRGGLTFWEVGRSDILLSGLLSWGLGLAGGDHTPGTDHLRSVSARELSAPLWEKSRILASQHITAGFPLRNHSPERASHSSNITQEHVVYS